VGGRKGITKVDCNELIRKADRDIRQLNYQLSTIISNGAQQKEITPDVPFEIDAIESVPYSMKARVIGNPTPVRFQVKYKTDGDFKIFMSKACKEPSEQNYQ
jgi:hypothetical protein